MATDEQMLIGRQAIEQYLDSDGREPKGIWPNFCSMVYLQAERERVENRGECSGRCDDTQLAIHPFTGEAVCPRTLKECPKHSLENLLELYGEVN